MPHEALDFNRGVTMRVHRASGVRIAMFKDEPGVFYNEKGEITSDDMARGAGFDVERLRIQREKQRKIEEYRKQVDAEFASVEENVAAMLSSKSDAFYAEPDVSGGYLIYERDTGRQVTRTPMTKEAAEHFIDEIRANPEAADSDYNDPEPSGKGSEEGDGDGNDDDPPSGGSEFSVG